MGQKKKVLLVDDEKDFLRITKLNLEETGKYEVVTLLSANDIIHQVQISNPDVIILDMLMQGMNGMEACKLLNNDPVVKDIPIMILSAFADYDEACKVYDLKVVDYLVKPIEKKELIAKLEKVLGNF